VKSSLELKEQISRKYNKDPTEWHVYNGRDIRRHVDTIITHGSDVWILKEEVINPFKTVGVGLRKKVDEPLGQSTLPSFGFRPLTDETMTRLVRAAKARNSFSEVMGSVLRQRPVPLDEAMGQSSLRGPILFSPHRLDVLPDQKDVDLRLRTELDRLILRKYPHLTTTYM